MSKRNDAECTFIRQVGTYVQQLPVRIALSYLEDVHHFRKYSKYFLCAGILHSEPTLLSSNPSCRSRASFGSPNRSAVAASSSPVTSVSASSLRTQIAGSSAVSGVCSSSSCFSISYRLLFFDRPRQYRALVV